MPICSACGVESERDFRFCPRCGAQSEAAAPFGEERRTVTVVFCDLAGSTALGESVDPERLRALLADYFERMKGIVEAHGGTVEKFIGDAVMAVFGVPVAHEDDALRAVRAAAEMRDALPELGLAGRIGVMTGEVVTGTAERLVTGDAVNVAARLEQAAAPGEVLIGQPTLDLVGGAVGVQTVEPLELKGKSTPVAAFRLLDVHEAPERLHDTPFVGRDRELGVLRGTWQRVIDERRCELVTVVGEAGIGKSRLTSEAVAAIDARVLRGRCLPYGEGITYWPVVEVLKQLEVRPADPTAATTIAALLGESDAPTSADEIAWAVRKTLEQAADQQPLLVVLDDIQWGGQTLLDLIEHVALLSTDAPILLLCMARPELAEQHPTWPVTLRLEPLREDDVAELIGEQVPDELRARIARAAGGNPLFVNEMLAVNAQASGEVVVPPTLNALLAARLDQLDPAERSLLEHASVEGELFHRGALQALAHTDMPITPLLASLVRKRLIRPDRSLIPGDDGFRFHHLLLRDTAYNALPKATRADLHATYAAWLQDHGSGLVELDELTGHHLHQACTYHAELGLEVNDALASRAKQHLVAAGRRAQQRSDYASTIGLLERAASLTPAGTIDLDLERTLVWALFWADRRDEALARADALATTAHAAGDEVSRLCAELMTATMRLAFEDEGSGRLDDLVSHALPILERAGNDVALYVANTALGQVAQIAGQMDAALSAYDSAVEHARLAGLPDRELAWRSAFMLFGPTPVPQLLAWLDRHEHEDPLNHWLRARRGLALAWLGRFDEARAIFTEIRTALAERGARMKLAFMCQDAAAVELLAGDAAAAVTLATEASVHLEAVGLRNPDMEVDRARALYAADRPTEAASTLDRAEALTDAGDIVPRFTALQLRAKLLADGGDHAAAEQLAREAVAIAETTDMLDYRGTALADLAEVLVLAGRPDEAAVAFAQALERYERKGILVEAERMRERLATLTSARTGR